MGRERKQTEEELFGEEEQPGLSPDEIAALRDREITRAELFRDMARPDLQKNIRMDTFSPLTKELKTSNIDRTQMEWFAEIASIAGEWFKLGAKKFATDLIVEQQTRLALAPSLGAKLLTLMATEYSVRRISDDKKGTGITRRLFKSGGGEEYG